MSSSASPRKNLPERIADAVAWALTVLAAPLIWCAGLLAHWSIWHYHGRLCARRGRGWDVMGWIVVALAAIAVGALAHLAVIIVAAS